MVVKRGSELHNPVLKRPDSVENPLDSLGLEEHLTGCARLGEGEFPVGTDPDHENLSALVELAADTSLRMGRRHLVLCGGIEGRHEGSVTAEPHSPDVVVTLILLGQRHSAGDLEIVVRLHLIPLFLATVPRLLYVAEVVKSAVTLDKRQGSVVVW